MNSYIYLYNGRVRAIYACVISLLVRMDLLCCVSLNSTLGLILLRFITCLCPMDTATHISVATITLLRLRNISYTKC